jgi:hypothetical protein
VVWARRGAPARRRRRDVARRARFGAPARFQFAVPLFDRSKLENFELKFRIAKYESCRPDNPLQLSQRRPIKISTDLEINWFEVAGFYGSVKLFSRALTEFLRTQTSKFEMPVIE